MSWWLYWRVVRSVRWRTRVKTCSRWVNMQIYSSFRYCSYCVPFSWLLCWRAVWCITTVEICSSEWTWQSLSLFITVAIVSRCPDDFTDGLGALCVGEPAWRLVLGEWTCKCISLFITVAIVSRFPDGFADGLCCGESPWRFVLGEWVNMQIYFSFHYCIRSYCVPTSWWLYWWVVRSVLWRTSVETCSRWVNMQMYFSFHYCSYCFPISWWLYWRAVWCITTVEICSRWVNMQIYFSFHYCSYCVPMFWWLLLTGCALENQRGDLF